MLTVEEIRSIEFEKSMRGYRPEPVHAFLDQISVQVEKLTAEKEELEKKLYILAAKVEEYRGEEDMLKTAMINAQRMGDKVIKEARQKADNIIREADLKASLIDEKAMEKKQSEEEKFLALQKNVAAFKAQVLAIYKTHIESLSELPSLEEDNYDDEDIEMPASFVNSEQTDEENTDTEQADYDDAKLESLDEGMQNFIKKGFADSSANFEVKANDDKNSEPISDENNDEDLNEMFGLGKSKITASLPNFVVDNSVDASESNEEETMKDSNIFSGFFENDDTTFTEDKDKTEKPPLKSSIFEKYNGINFND